MKTPAWRGSMVVEAISARSLGKLRDNDRVSESVSQSQSQPRDAIFVMQKNRKNTRSKNTRA